MPPFSVCSKRHHLGIQCSRTEMGTDLSGEESKEWKQCVCVSVCVCRGRGGLCHIRHLNATLNSELKRNNYEFILF